MNKDYVILEKKAIPMQCHRCKHPWNYTGANEYVAVCPHCRTTVSLRKHKVNAGAD